MWSSLVTSDCCRLLGRGQALGLSAGHCSMGGMPWACLLGMLPGGHTPGRQRHKSQHTCWHSQSTHKPTYKPSQAQRDPWRLQCAAHCMNTGGLCRPNHSQRAPKSVLLARAQQGVGTCLQPTAAGTHISRSAPRPRAATGGCMQRDTVCCSTRARAVCAAQGFALEEGQEAQHSRACQ